MKFLKEDEEPVIRTAVTYMIEGQVSDEEFSKIKSYCINPVDSRETGMEKPDTLITVYVIPLMLLFLTASEIWTRAV